MSSKEDHKKRYQIARYQRQHSGLMLSQDAGRLLSFMETNIKKEFQSFTLFSICGGERRIPIDPKFQAAFLTLSYIERIDHYEWAVYHLAEMQKETSLDQIARPLNENRQILSIKVLKGLKEGPAYKIQLGPYSLDCGHYEIPLQQYLLRKSRSQKKVLILESTIKQEPMTLRFQLEDPAMEKELCERAKQQFYEYVSRLNSSVAGRSPPREAVFKISKRANSSPHIEEKSRTSPKNCSESPVRIVTTQNFDDSVVNEIVQDRRQPDSDSESEDIFGYISRKNQQFATRQVRKNVARLMMSDYNLHILDEFGDCVPLFKDDQKGIFVYYHKGKAVYKLELLMQHQPRTVARHLCEMRHYKLWNSAINQSHQKLWISSDNTCIEYLKQKAVSQWFRERDFLFLRHCARSDNKYYIFDRSIDSTEFIPFQSIHRGAISHSITRISPSSGPNTPPTRLVMQVHLEYGGLLSFKHKQEMALRYLTEFANLDGFIGRFSGKFKNKFDLDWEVPGLEQNTSQQFSSISVSSVMFEEPLERIDEFGGDEDEFFSIVSGETEEVRQISPQQLRKTKNANTLKQFNNEQIQLNEEGYSILPQKYLTIKHPVVPINLPEKRLKLPYDNLMLKDDFGEDKGGGMKLIDDVKAAAQDNVIKFVMNTFKNNLFSGKSLLSISLPVEIFNVDSNIQRLCSSMAMAPDLLEKAVQPQDALERFKYCLTFAMTNSILYFDISKPFNPILGQTFQGLINGCPVYGEQISHHPPISSLLFIGRGYRVYGNLEAKVYVHLNSGEGVNEGLYTVEFDDGNKIIFQTPPGEVSGLVAGNRKYRIKGKMFVLDVKNRLFCCVHFEDQSGFFSSNKWTYNDQLEGEIVRVSSAFVRRFFQSREGRQAATPSEKEIQERLSKVSGRWLYDFVVDGQQFFNTRTMPHQMIHYEYPLNSNSNYREDLIYRKKNDLARSQAEKERLQIMQRADRKHREKYYPKK